MIVHSFRKISLISSQTASLLFKRDAFPHLKTFKMELVNSVITEPYQNGISGLKKGEQLCWIGDEKYLFRYQKFTLLEKKISVFA